MAPEIDHPPASLRDVVRTLMGRSNWVLGMVWAVLAVSPLACGDDDADGGCFSDDECPYGEVCNRDASTCMNAPGDCNGDCMTESRCGFDDYDACIKNQCGASFLQYYRDSFGADCEQAWLDLMECNSNLSCDDYERYRDEVNAEAGTAPFCQSELQAKNSEC